MTDGDYSYKDPLDPRITHHTRKLGPGPHYEPARWRPSRPEPLWIGPFLLWAQCECGRRFGPWLGDTAHRYEMHWRIEHAPHVGPDSDLLSPSVKADETITQGSGTDGDT